MDSRRDEARMNSTIMLQSIYENGTFYEFEPELFTEKLSKGLAYCLLFLVSIIGNILIIWAIHRDNRLKNGNVNILVFNIAISDILATLVRLPVQTVSVFSHDKWTIGGKAGAGLCKFIAFHFDLSFAVSVYSCLLIAIDRYYAVTHPFKGGCFSRSRLKYIIPGIWIFAGIICIPTLYNVDLGKNNGQFYCFEDWSENDHFNWLTHYFYILILLTNGIPFFAMAGIYIMTLFRLHTHAHGVQGLSDVIRRKKELQNKKILKMHLFIMSFLFFSLIVDKIFLVLFATGKLDNLSISLFAKLDFITGYIFNLFVIYNFFAFLIFNEIYRQNFKAAFSKCFSV